eukprot:CAMPEP_0118947298 /NCGR_PEP_ID=MMETSP1169-20130426/45754_1 /TAXON_ID=36882 /ORGANISM="Pyramimonas obovata, Strain CCMP722" /LENGTH=58 /DNA_ID=CAMNT_0006893483 /DNA_START=42 /DNA_END=215 /DNA_ORIENTATION=+
MIGKTSKLLRAIVVTLVCINPLPRMKHCNTMSHVAARAFAARELLQGERKVRHVSLKQ